MAIAPTETYDWAVNLSNNGPTGGPNRIDVPAEQQDDGWLFNEKPAYEIMNGWNYSIKLWLDYMNEVFGEQDTENTNLQDQIDTINDFTIPDNGATTSESFLIGNGLANDNPKYFYAETDEATAFQSYLVLRRAPEFDADGNTPLKWFAKENEFQVSVYNNNEIPLINPAEIFTEGQIKSLADEQIQVYHANDVEVFFIDVTFLGNTDEPTAKATAEAQVVGAVEGDRMTVTWLLEGLQGTGNSTITISITQVNNYTFTTGVWV